MKNSKTESETLIRDYLDGSISKDDFGRLETMLASDREARTLLRRMALIEEGMTDYANAHPHQVGLQHSDVPLNKSVWQWLPWAIATAACVMLMVGVSQRNKKQDENPVRNLNVALATSNEDVKPVMVARLVDEVDARFENEGWDPAAGFETGDYFLQSGSVHLRFTNGADMLVQSPARFSILSDKNIVLHDGNLRASFPPEARGFRVGTPGVEYHDLGTEFGVSANSQTMQSEVHVFQGRVNSMLLGDAEGLMTFNSGQAVIYRDGVLQDTTISDSSFLVPGALGFKRWQRRQEYFRNQPGLIAYFPIYQTLDGSLHNHAIIVGETDQLQPVTARVGAATWATGRWNGKQSLLFNSKEDFVQLNIPGEFEELSFSVWAKFNSLKQPHNAILNSNGWDEGDVHWQLNRLGGCWIAAHGAKDNKMERSVPLGRWVHLTGTLSRITGTSEVYLNGELVSVGQIGPEVVLRPGLCCLGNWVDSEEPEAFQKPNSLRGLDGWIDELMIWDRRLEPLEIRQLIEMGKPSALWAAKTNSD